VWSMTNIRPFPFLRKEWRYGFNTLCGIIFSNISSDPRKRE